MKELVLFAIGLFFASIASGATPPSCPKEMAGQKSCISGDTMVCIKKFDPKIKDFTYDWEAVNSSGQSFGTDNPLYKKVPGFTPTTCVAPTPTAAKQVSARKTI